MNEGEMQIGIRKETHGKYNDKMFVWGGVVDGMQEEKRLVLVQN